MKRSRKRWIKSAGWALAAVLLVEGGARLLWLSRGAGFFSAHRNVYRSFYPELVKALRSPTDDEAECFDVLLLGGSALHLDYGNIEHLLRERLIRQARRCVRIHNLSAAAQTTLDSFYKYRHLAGRRFDVVIVYHGINETRANNCDADTFAADYSHYAWYRLINDFERRAEDRWFIAPYTVKFVAVKVAQRLGLSRAAPTHRPDEASLTHGCDIKTDDSLRNNLQRIAELAQVRREPVVLMTFAYHIPQGYSESAMRERSLDYTAHTFPIELWGRPDCVRAGLDAHNQVVRELAQGLPGVLFVDQAERIPPTGTNFNDVCHLTHDGCARFVDNLLPLILPLR